MQKIVYYNTIVSENFTKLSLLFNADFLFDSFYDRDSVGKLIGFPSCISNK